jgi:hypothetical protein
MINQHLIIISIIIISSFILAFTRQTLRRLANPFFFSRLADCPEVTCLILP